jgi:NADPH:quinone reductase
VHGAAGRVGTALLELGSLVGLRLYGTASTDDCELVERRGATAIDYQREDFLLRVRELPGRGVDVALDGIGGGVSVRSFRALRPGGRLVVYGHYSTLSQGRKSWRGWAEWYASIACVGVAGVLSPEATGAELPDRQAARPPSGLVSRGLRRPGRAAAGGQDPPDRRRVTAAHHVRERPSAIAKPRKGRREGASARQNRTLLEPRRRDAA